jgi:hypothetical protein
VAIGADHTIGARVGTTSAENAYYGYVGAVLLRVPFLAVAWVLTSLWLTVARDNALLIAPQGQRRSAVWVWLGWVVPIIQYWFPKLILDDSIRATAPAARRPTYATGWFWAAWIALSLLQNLQLQILDDTQITADSIRPGLDVAVAAVGTVALVLWTILVRRVSRIQDELAQDGPGYDYLVIAEPRP